MRRDACRLEVATSSSRRNAQLFRLVVLILTIALAALNIACIGLSQGNPSSSSLQAGRIAISWPSTSCQVGVAYNAVASVSGGTAPYTFSWGNGTLPPGTALNATTGSLTGMPTKAGLYNFFLMVADSANNQGITSVYIQVAAGSTTQQQPTITISPSSTSLASQAVQQFTATVTGTSNTAVAWSASAGTISSNGSFTAPTVSSNTSVTVTASSTSVTGLKASASVAITPLPALSITTTTLGDATAGVPFSATLVATGGKSPYTWSISSGALPTGIQLTAASGAIAGTTSSTGAFSFTAKVTDSAGNTATQAYSLAVASNTGYDGPAQLPLVYINTAMSNTPAPGSTIAVASGGNLQTALNSANCGDTITLQAGATYSGVFTFPAKNCNNNNWIIVRTSSPDSALPAEGSRLTPCYAGVASLPGRPALNCTSTTNVTAKLVIPSSGLGPIVFATGANYYRLIGLEVTRMPNTGIVYELSSIAVGGTANNLILDRMWLHGTAQDETTEGLELIGASYVSVIDSTLTDFHCISVSGACTDAHAVGGSVDNPVGPFKITDDFLEASGENVMFGGGQATNTPADIQISQNFFFKPLTWMPGQPGFVGGANGNPFIVKNFLELKNAQRVLIEANLMENNWGGFSQDGSGILIGPKNQAASNGPGNLCPVCQVTDVTVRYNYLSHVGAGLQIANALSDNGGGALAGERYSLHDLVIDDINPVLYNGSGHLAEVMTLAGTALLQDVVLNHITAFPPSGLFSIGDTAGTKIPNFTFTNSLVTTGTYPIWSTGGGTANCAYYDIPLTTFNACFNPYTMTNNGLISDPSNYPPSSWPTGNFFPANPAAVQFTNYNNGNGGNYLLLPSSPYKNAGTDGKDLGADIVGLQTQLAGVE
jgi:hypothetical protein